MLKFILKVSDNFSGLHCVNGLGGIAQSNVWSWLVSDAATFQHFHLWRRELLVDVLTVLLADCQRLCFV